MSAMLATGTAIPIAASAAAGARPTAQTVVGAWNGRWISADGRGHGSVEVVLARTPNTDDVVGQFTFITGGVSRSVRYEGRVQDGRVQFPLVGDGHILLEVRNGARPGEADRLRGEWNDARGALPAPQGVIALSRTK